MPHIVKLVRFLGRFVRGDGFEREDLTDASQIYVQVCLRVFSTFNSINVCIK